MGRGPELPEGWESQAPGGALRKGHFQEMAGPGKGCGRDGQEGRLLGARADDRWGQEAQEEAGTEGAQTLPNWSKMHTSMAGSSLRGPCGPDGGQRCAQCFSCSSHNNSMRDLLISQMRKVKAPGEVTTQSQLTRLCVSDPDRKPCV